MRGRRSPVLGRFVPALVVLLICAPPAAHAASAQCEDLEDLRLPAADVTSADMVDRGGFRLPDVREASTRFAAVPPFCRVRVTARPSRDSDIKIEVWLPATGWNGKFQAVGNGGWAGVIPYVSLAGAITAGYASAGTDAGHEGNTASFAVGHPERVIDMGYRAVHEMTVHAKAIIAAYYGTAPALSLWNACSTGGRQGITAAVRYPEDFDGVVAGAPAVNWMHLHAGRLALHQAVNRTPAHRIPAGKYPAIHAAVVNACDPLDGVVDGVIENPRACSFDPAVLECRGTDTADCLTRPQVESASAFYAAVTDPSTGALVMPGLERGTELAWATLGGDQPLGNAVEAFKYVVYRDSKWDWRTFTLAEGLRRALDADGGVLGSTDANLGPFFARGGKLLIYHGWNDPQVPPGNTIAFYTRMLDTVGAETAARSAALFLVPGMNHCSGGTGADRFNGVSVLEQWIATGTPPARIPASRVVEGQVIRTRPLCPYPQVATWNGTGSTDEEANFSCTPSAP
jgi:feruloyl esterase